MGCDIFVIDDWNCQWCVVMIAIFGKSFNYREDSTQNFIFVLLFTSLLKFKCA